jgi:1-acyl-sn-glycerol-3-phosphate acyltransferase
MFYEFLRAFFFVTFSVVFRYRMTGQENLPAQGGYILAANHLSLWDPPLIATLVPAHIHYMAKQELFEIPILSSLLRVLGVFPVKRATADRGAIRTAINLLQAGKVVGIFPEGTRSKTGRLQQPEAGLELIASLAKVPVVPIAIVGTNRVFKAGCLIPHFEVHFGKAVCPSDKYTGKSKNSLTTEVMQSIQLMIDENYKR